MCGILGVYKNSGVNKSLFNTSLKLLQNRGPDNSSVSEISKNVFFGHTRLSIIDLDSSNNQPFIYNNFTLTYNGEIFNYIELREELIKLGFNFSTDGDTEVLLKSYVCWGENCVNKFNGMWSFVIHDSLTNKFFCSRDRFGIKPFYYYCDDNLFIFSSQIKPILNYDPSLKNVNYSIINDYFNSGKGADSEETWFKNIFRLKPAHNLIFNGSLKLIRYWNYPNSKINSSFEESKNHFFKLFKDSVKIRLRSDVKLASTITAGLDSSSIVAMSNHINNQIVDTYTSFSDNNSFGKSERSIFSKNEILDESKTIEKIKHKLNINPHYNKVDFTSYYLKLRKVIHELESPHSSTATVSAYSLYEDISKQHTVILEGQGADEMLGGYVTELFPTLFWHNLKKMKFISLIKLINDISKSYSLINILKTYVNSLFKNRFLIKYKMKILKSDVLNKNTFKKAKSKYSKRKKSNLLISQHEKGLVNLLHYGDSLSMSNSIETRFPFLDYRLVEYCFKLPFEYLYFKGKGKFILRESMKKLLPTEIYDSTLKLGFITPIEKILKNDNQIKKLLYEKDSLEIFDEPKLKDLLDKFYLGNFDHTTIIFKILSIKIWINIFIDEK